MKTDYKKMVELYAQAFVQANGYDGLVKYLGPKRGFKVEGIVYQLAELSEMLGNLQMKCWVTYKNGLKSVSQK